MVQPTTKESGPNSLGLPVTVLPPGASRTLLFKGGPHPWVGKPSFFFSDGKKQKTASALLTPSMFQLKFRMRASHEPHCWQKLNCLTTQPSSPASNSARPRWSWGWATRCPPPTRSPASRREASLSIVHRLPRSAKLRW